MITIACYVRTTALFLPFILLFLRSIHTQEFLRTIGTTAIIIILMVLLIIPWSIRNTSVYGEFVLISANIGIVLWQGGHYPDSRKEIEQETKSMNLAQRNDYLLKRVLDHIKSNPVSYVIRSFNNLIYLHSRETIGIHWNEKGLVSRYGSTILFPLKIISQVYWLCALGLALVGIILLGHYNGWFSLITHPSIIVWGYFASVHAMTLAVDRYHFYSIPMIAILAAFTLWRVKIMLIHKSQSP